MESYKTKGTCSRQIDFEVEDNKVKSVRFTSGCEGNLKGISSLVEGMDIDWVIERLQNIQCGMKGTSCPDQLSKALREYKANQA